MLRFATVLWGRDCGERGAECGTDSAAMPPIINDLEATGYPALGEMPRRLRTLRVYWRVNSVGGMKELKGKGFVQ